jgi:hypothetical protein
VFATLSHGSLAPIAAWQLLALSLVHKDAMSEEQIADEVDRLLLLLTSVSPEGAMLTSEGLQRCLCSAV